MALSPDIASVLLEAGLLMALVLLAQVVLLRHLPVDAMPDVLRGRAELSTRLRPWLLGAAVAMTAAGALLRLA